MEKRVKIYYYPFLSMLAATEEKRQKECYGELFGNVRKVGNELIYYIRLAQPIQTSTHKGFSGIIPGSGSQKVIEFMQKNSEYETIGSFHSHVQYGNIDGGVNWSLADYLPSKDDVLYYLKPYPEDIAIILTMNSTTKKRSWFLSKNKENYNKCCFGSLETRSSLFNVEIAAYYYYKRGKNEKKNYKAAILDIDDCLKHIS